MSNYSMMFSVPLFVYYKGGRNPKKFALNLNEYRNAHYQVLSKSKKKFEHELFYATKVVRSGSKITKPVKMRFVLWVDGTRNIDLSNVCSVVDKFVCDAIVSAGILEDDSYKYIVSSCYELGGIDKDNPRVDVTITET